MKIVRSYTTVLARFLISAVFLAGAINKILHWQETESFLMNTLCDWQANSWFSEEFQDFMGMMVPWTPILIVLATLAELVGGLLVLLGIKEKLGASLLILFLIPCTILIHAFWFVDGSSRELQITHFLKNLSILGGLLMIILQGTEKPGNPFPPVKF